MREPHGAPPSTDKPLPVGILGHEEGGGCVRKSRSIRSSCSPTLISLATVAIGRPMNEAVEDAQAIITAAEGLLVKLGLC